MGTKYIDVPASDLLGTLENICEKIEKAGGTCSKGQSGQEITFDIMLPKSTVILKIYTSLGAGDNSVRDCGKDAVRIVIGTLVENDRFKPLDKSRRIYRTAPKGNHDNRVKAFLDRLTQALREEYKKAKSHPTCFDCGRPMQLRENSKTKHKFWGCSGYPSCKKTFNHVKKET
jgi:hypothetical protein